jgi:hypothetical protein
VDYENDLELLPNGSEVLVLGCTTTNNLIFQEAVVSKVDINTSAILYERAYASSAAGQTMICPFTLSSDGVLGSIGVSFGLAIITLLLDYKQMSLPL